MDQPLCCLLEAPAECARCSALTSEMDKSFIWVFEGGKASAFCSPMCLVRSFVKRTAE